ncbi:MAG: UDP-N-acetylmuramoyl-L-alanine--D-glutamate ligase [Treponema sp.]|uniref:UDP-N-acetylmuramoyl-L-alanine--D-glutamate ligase n=1 Tax=Treponema sp. TaxID=166 RepID=UPI00298DB9D0|nr:UDP-N-acetylmuramoyl-L-alanine--D-glutamate ligase [Treponema sp.]MBR5932567.1 UDP-N-acetylmuramoyl-L-alanine--D-glutamate ligase [Treponema sp.]
MSYVPHVYPEGCFFNSIEDIKDKHVTVMGLGLNGGGEASVRFLLKHGAYVLATDMKTEEQLKPTIDSINSDKTLDTSRLTYILGEHRVEDFSNADCVIKNPGIKIEGNKYLAAAKNIETDISLFLKFTKAKIIAVTGSKGKSSTVSAIYYGLKEAKFDVYLGGNITVSPLNFLDETSDKSVVVLELSSWQLADLRGRKLLKPYIALITKIVPDHQNWYENMGDYVADKRLVYADQDEKDFTIVDFDGDAIGTGPKQGGTWGDFFAKETKGTVLRYSQTDLRTYAKVISGAWQTFDDNNIFSGMARLPQWQSPKKILGKLKVPGRHMRCNTLNAALVMAIMGVEPSLIESILANWTGIPHRLQFFHTWKNSSGQPYKFYNDSCATVPEAAAAASQAFGKPVVFITGGTDKGLEFDILADTLNYKESCNTKVADLYLLAGTGTDKLTVLLDKAQIKYKGPFDSLESLFAQLKQSLDSGEAESDTVVFSPGATSFGMFTNEFDRGNKFMDGVKRIFS